MRVAPSAGDVQLWTSDQTLSVGKFQRKIANEKNFPLVIDTHFIFIGVPRSIHDDSN